jgi:hypothetical protein
MKPEEREASLNRVAQLLESTAQLAEDKALPEHIRAALKQDAQALSELQAECIALRRQLATLQGPPPFFVRFIVRVLRENDVGFALRRCDSGGNDVQQGAFVLKSNIDSSFHTSLSAACGMRNTWVEINLAGIGVPPEWRGPLPF